ncbi:protein kinase [Streptomyces sp. NPDC060194]|uniref:protein kinase n=1 Tax=Streptomyces sp. NPDC060194 TaxID=3347069 RepID=UPI003653652B
MDEYAGRVLADRYRLPLPPSDAYELSEAQAFDTYSGQEVLVRQVPLPEVVDAEVLDGRPGRGEPGGSNGSGGPAGPAGPAGSSAGVRTAVRGGTRRAADPAVRRAIEAAQAAAAIPDHPRLDQVFDVFEDGGSLWVVSERVAARPLAALLAERPLSPYRAAEVAHDVLVALRVLHAHGWTHRNITARTVLVCDDGRVMLTGLAAGAAEEALCGYDPRPEPDGERVAPQANAPEGPSGTRPSVPGPSAVPGPAAGPRRDAGGPQGPGPAQPRQDPAAGPAYADRPTAGVRQPGGAASGHGPDRRPAPGAPSDDGQAEGPARPWPPGVGAAGAGSGQRPAQGAPAPYAGRPVVGPAREWPPAPPQPVPQQSGQPGGGGGGSGASGAPGVSGAPNLPAPASPAAASQMRPARAELPDAADVRAARAGAIAAYRAGARAAARVNEAQRGSGTPQGGAQPVRELPGQAQRIADPYGVAGRTAAAPPAQRGRPEPDGGQRPALPAPQQPGTAYPGPQQPGPRPGPPQQAPQRPGTGLERTAPHPQQSPRPPQSAQPQPHTLARPYVPQQSPPQSAPHPSGPAPWDRPAAPLRGPATPLAAERARQARMAVVGPVTERWAPEQAGPVHGNWQLAPPVGPATDLWALGALLFRAVQGHAPYPEDSAAELVQLVCAEPPAFAEECGPLRPVVESLLRADPTERPDVEELRGWLRSLVRSAPEPEAGVRLVPLPSTPPPHALGAGIGRLPVVRRRGDMVKRPRGTMVHGRHKRGRQRSAAPRSLGRWLLAGVLLLLAGAVAYAMFLMPKAGSQDGAEGQRPQGIGGGPSARPSAAEPTAGTSPDDGGPAPAPSRAPQTTAPAPERTALPEGFVLRKDLEKFQLAVPSGWDRQGQNALGQVTYTDGKLDLIVVPGRDSVAEYGDGPAAYQSDHERELQAFRDAQWTSMRGVKEIGVGDRRMAEGQYTWGGGRGGDTVAYNGVMIVDGRYHVVQVRGPKARQSEVADVFEQAFASYRA